MLVNRPSIDDEQDTAIHIQDTPVKRYRRNYIVDDDDISAESDITTPSPSSSSEYTKYNISDTLKPADMKWMHIGTHIQTRFSSTLVSSRVVNVNQNASQQLSFTMTLPENAFISNFSL